jgi:hypothetical protein
VLCVSIIWLAQILEWALQPENGSALDALLTAAHLTRVLRYTHRLPPLRLLLRALVHVAPAVSGMTGVLLLVLYSYGVVGCWLFSGLLVPGTLPVSLPYVSNDWWSLHFNDLAHALMALFQQMVVNDWWLLMDAMAERVGQGSRMYFIAFYCTTTLAVCSVCTALVVQAYLVTQKQEDRRVSRALKRAKAGQLQSSSSSSSGLPNVSRATAAGPMITPSTGMSGGSTGSGASFGSAMQRAVAARVATTGYRLQLHEAPSLRHALKDIFGEEGGEE